MLLDACGCIFNCSSLPSVPALTPSISVRRNSATLADVSPPLPTTMKPTGTPMPLSSCTCREGWVGGGEHKTGRARVAAPAVHKCMADAWQLRGRRGAGYELPTPPSGRTTRAYSG